MGAAASSGEDEDAVQRAADGDDVDGQVGAAAQRGLGGPTLAEAAKHDGAAGGVGDHGEVLDPVVGEQRVELRLEAVAGVVRPGLVVHEALGVAHDVAHEGVDRRGESRC